MPITKSSRPIWTTSDDKTHTDHSAACLHENMISNAGQVDKYLDSLKGKNKDPLSDRARVAQFNSIMGFLAWDIRRAHPPEMVVVEEE